MSSGKHFHNVLCLSEAKGMDIIMAVNTIYNPDVLIIQTDKNIFESNSLIDFEVFDKKGWNVKTRMEQMQFENCYNAYKWIIMQLLDD